MLHRIYAYRPWNMLIIAICVYFTATIQAASPNVLIGEALNTKYLKAYKEAAHYFSIKEYDLAADSYWFVLANSQSDSSRDKVNSRHLLQAFVSCFSARNITEDAFVYIAKKYFQLRQVDEAINYLHQSVQTKPSAEALLLLAEHSGIPEKNEYLAKAINLLDSEPTRYSTADKERLMISAGNLLFTVKQFNLALRYFELAYSLGNSTEAFANAFYMRSNIFAWGSKGEIYDEVVEKLESILWEEKGLFLIGNYNRASVVHPHMSLGYSIEPSLKLHIARSHALLEQRLVMEAGLAPKRHDAKWSRDLSAQRLKIGYVSANIKSKTTAYMAQDVLGFHDNRRVEVHVFATTPPDSALFIERAMRGVDWREKIAGSVEYFHNVSHLDVLQLANKIYELGIHVLVDWDGYSNNGVRKAGLFALRPSPVQVAHQEYIGTMGAPYFDYIITDKIASPKSLEHLYSEKFLWMPHSFLASSFAYQDHMSPSSERVTAELCRDAFCYCNFNKHLKFNPHTMRLWLEILSRSASSNSKLILLENPSESISNILDFAESFEVSTSRSKSAQTMRNRIIFLPFMSNPYDNQRRVGRTCHAVLDSDVYNSHTTAADALWGGVPVVAWGNGVDMAGRVGQSILTALGLSELVAPSATGYKAIALELALNKTRYEIIRRRIVEAASQAEPMNPFWDIRRYARSLETGFLTAWQRFKDGLPAEHIEIEENALRRDELLSSDALSTRKMCILEKRFKNIRTM